MGQRFREWTEVGVGWVQGQHEKGQRWGGEGRAKVRSSNF